MPTKKKGGNSAVCRNRKAGFRFEILEEIECGICLLGTEVKALRERGASLEESYARIEGDELWLVKFHIAPYRFGNQLNHDPTRRRKLLIHKRELRKLKPKVELKGMTLVPTRIYFNDRGIAKVAVGVARGKRTFDKRESIKTREHQREMNREARRAR